MCGIVGLFGKHNTWDDKTLERATKVLFHRGPDGQRIWVHPSGMVGLGHARLSIIDLNGGHQPLRNEDGSIVAVINGELYGYQRLQESLRQRGHHLATNSDSEVAIHLYEELGLDFLSELRGEFALILWDEKRRRLIAARDRFGIKPLFYALHNQTLYVASEIKALLAAGVPAAWDEQSLYHAAHLGVPMPGRSLVRGTSQVPPGHVLIAEEETWRMHQYWDFDYPMAGEERVFADPDDATHEFRRLFEEAVSLRLTADVPVGVYLSGGLDSCAILGTAAKLKSSTLKAFNIKFGDAAYDESSVAQEMAAHVGADLATLEVTPRDIAQHFVAAVTQSETLLVNGHGVAKYLLSKAVRDSGYKVVLTGEGSDEILAGYPHFRRDLLLHSPDHGVSGSVEAALESLARTNTVSRFMLPEESSGSFGKSAEKRLGFVPSWIEAQLGSSRNQRRILSDALRKAHAGYDPLDGLLSDIDLAGQVTGRHPLHQSLYLWSKTLLPNYPLSNLGDRMEMGHSVEGRVPFLDHKLVEFTVRLPVDLKIRNLREKHILREAARPVLTKTVYERQKHPFVAPPTTGTQDDPLFATLKEYICDHLGDTPVLSAKAVHRILDQYPKAKPEDRQMLDPPLMMAASVVALQKAYGL